MRLKVTKTYRTKYKAPIELKTGDVVRLGKEETKEEWLGWIWAETDSNAGWIPKQIVQTSDNITGKIIKNYSAKELDADEGDILISEYELNGWLWVVNDSTKETGWIPKENVTSKIRK